MAPIRRKQNFAIHQILRKGNTSKPIWRPFEDNVSTSKDSTSDDTFSHVTKPRLEQLSCQKSIKSTFDCSNDGFSNEVFNIFYGQEFSGAESNDVFKPILSEYPYSLTSSLNSSRCGSLGTTSPVEVDISTARDIKTRRAKYSGDQLLVLNGWFERKMYLSNEERYKLSIHLNLEETQIKNWFQNKRMKTKRDYLTSIQRGRVMPIQSPDLPKFSRMPENYFHSISV